VAGILTKERASATESATARRPFVSVVVPAYNEESIVERNLRTLITHLESLEKDYRWELIFVNDGSTDRTGEIADAFAQRLPAVEVVHHVANFNLGQALQTGFAHARGEYVVVMDLDLSYSPDHVERLVSALIQTRSDIVVASPYMKGGRVTRVPWVRLQLSRWANRFLAFFSAHTSIRTLTGMVRAYDRAFLQSINLKSTGVDINAEIIYKAMLFHGRITEIPAHLDWSLQRSEGIKRISSFKIARGIVQYALSGFMFRPFMFFFLPGLTLLLVAFYVIGWIFFNVYAVYPTVSAAGTYFDDRFSEAVALVFNERPHAFFVGGITLLFALQLLSLGFLALQSKRYFEELFHLGSVINTRARRDDG
jgi:glycosyltransferase involved in cell wall biosynthesis